MATPERTSDVADHEVARMSFYASVDGHITPAAEARVSVLDNGFTFGDGAYETLRTYGGRPFALARHLRRLRASVARLGFDLPLSDDELRARLEALLAAAGNAEAYIRLLVTRGVGDCSYHFERVQGPTVVMLTKPHVAPAERAYEEGVAVALVDVRRNSPRALDPAIKASSLLNNVLATRAAQAHGAFEALMLNEQGEVCEGAGSNVFVVRQGRVSTPPLAAGILAGITREILMELAPAAGHVVHEQTLTVAELRAADEAFLTSTLKEVLPIGALDGLAVGNGHPGPVTRALLAAYRAYAARHEL
jgi:branched-chain amino acid aminotransferase